MNAVSPVTSNWQAYLDLKFRPGEEKTHLIPVKRYGPLSVQRPFYPENNLCHTYLLHPPGGVVGGDRLDLRIQSEKSSAALVTVPGATKFYQSGGQVAEVRQLLGVEEAASLEFLPQENIYFPGARVKAHTTLKVGKDATALLWEKHCFGRPANHENFEFGHVKSRLDVETDGELVFTETQRIDIDEIKSSSGLRHNPVMGTCVIVSENLNAGLVEQCRELSHDVGVSGLTRIDNNLMLARYMSNSTRDLNAYFVRLWEIIRPTVMGRDACHPRIWNT